MKTLFALALAGSMIAGATSIAAAQNYTPSLGLPHNAYLPPIDAGPNWAPGYVVEAPAYTGRSTYVTRPSLQDRYRGYTEGEE